MKKSIRKMVMLLGACTLLYSCSEDGVRDSLRENKAVSTSVESFLSKSQVTLENSAILLIQEDLQIDGRYARQLYVRSYSPDLIMEKTMAINYNDYTDDGKYNDKVAGDGIYTSVNLHREPVSSGSVGGALISDSFSYHEELMTSIIKIKCKFKRKTSGYTMIFHDDCSRNWCVELYDCSLELGF